MQQIIKNILIVILLSIIIISIIFYWWQWPGLLLAMKSKRIVPFGSCNFGYCVDGAILSPQETLKNSTAVFAGKVIKLEGSRPLMVTLRILDVWKGQIFKDTIAIATGYTEDIGSAEGSYITYPFVNGKKYLIYAYIDRGENLLRANTGYFSSGIIPLSDAKKDLKELGLARRAKLLLIVDFLALLIISVLLIKKRKKEIIN